MAREIAVTPDWAMIVMTGKESTDEERKASRALMESNDSRGDFGPGSIFLSSDRDQAERVSRAIVMI